MGVPEADWKEQERHVLDWVVVGTVLALVGVYLSLAAVDGRVAYYGVAGLLLAWLVVFFTGYWQTILYLPAVILVTGVAAVWLLQGGRLRPLTLLAVFLSAVFAVLAAYLLLYEDPVL